MLDENIVLDGDLGWDDDLDGPLRLGDGGWVDGWLELRGGEASGWTRTLAPSVRSLFNSASGRTRRFHLDQMN